MSNTSDLMGVSPLRGIARLRTCKRRRESSWDRTGGNKDYISVAAGTTARFVDIENAGFVTHIWCTINCKDEYILRKALIRMYWDNEQEPSVEVPLGDFFGIGFSMSKNFTSLPLSMNPEDGRGMNCYFPMPFSTAARMEIVNQSDTDIKALYFYVDWEQHETISEDWGRFHAQWRRDASTLGWGDNSRRIRSPDGSSTEYSREIYSVPNLGGEGNYVILEAEGRGHYVGCNLNIHRYSDQKNPWYGEGDDVFFIDGEKEPSFRGTGTEDYFNMAWAPRQEFCGPYSGLTHISNPDWSGRNSMYRFHIEDPVHFSESILVTIEHGHANNLELDYSSTAYWYQSEPHLTFPRMLGVHARVPRVL